MTARRVYDRDGGAHFITFSGYHRRRLLDHVDAKQIVLDVLRDQLCRQNGRCVGFVIMPDHVDAILWFPAPDQLSRFMKQWKQRTSIGIKRLLRAKLTAYAATFKREDPIWQARYYDFNVYTERKMEEKLVSMH
jgi:putative transposase